MARQKGIIVIKGTVGGLNFYVRKGEPLVRKAGGGFNGDAIKKKDSMVRVRENGSEFGACTKVTKQFKMSLNPFLTKFSDGTRHHRLIQLFSQIKKLDEVSLRGERNVNCGMQTTLGVEKLSGYIITPGNSLSKILNHPFHFGWDDEGFAIADFSVSDIKFPKGATHIEITTCYLIFDFDSCTYSRSISAPFIIGKDYTETTVRILPNILPDGDGFKIGVVFLRFMQEIGGERYPFKETDYTVLEIVYVKPIV